jgi:hypothetical protein
VVEAITAAAGDPGFPRARAVAERVEAEVFGRAFGETPEALRGYYEDHLPQTVFVVVRDRGEWAAAARLAVPGPLVSLTLEDAAVPPFEADVPGDLGVGADRLLDILTAGVRPGHRARRLVEAMAAATVDVARSHGCSHLIGMVDRRLHGYLRRRGMPPRRHASWHPYFGSPATTVASGAVADVAAWLAAPSR